MPRRPKFRWVAGRPIATIFKPAGVPGRQIGWVELRLDELEALRLADAEGLYFDAAGEQMGVSRATFGRLVEQARHKVAHALVNGKAILIKGGQVQMPQMRVFECAECGERFEVEPGTGRPEACPECGSEEISRAELEMEAEDGTETADEEPAQFDEHADVPEEGPGMGQGRGRGMGPGGGMGQGGGRGGGMGGGRGGGQGRGGGMGRGRGRGQGGGGGQGRRRAGRRGGGQGGGGGRGGGGGGN